MGYHDWPLCYTCESTVGIILDICNIKFEDISILGSSEATQRDERSGVFVAFAIARVWEELSEWVESLHGGFNTG